MSFSIQQEIVYISTSIWVSRLWVHGSVQPTKQPTKAVPIPKAKTPSQETLSLCSFQHVLTFVYFSLNTMPNPDENWPGMQQLGCELQSTII